MSSVDQTFWIGILLAVAGLGAMWPSAWRSSDKRKSSAQSLLGSAIFNLGLAVLVTAPSISSIEGWSAPEKVIGVGVLLLLTSAGVQLGIAIERWRRQKPQRVGTGFSPR
jgi:hypothetical protein